MEFTLYKMGDLQRCRSILKGLEREGLTTLAQAGVVLDGIISGGHAALSQSPRRVAAVEICPSCGKGVVARWPRVSNQVGADVYGCKRCQWSEVR